MALIRFKISTLADPLIIYYKFNVTMVGKILRYLAKVSVFHEQQNRCVHVRSGLYRDGQTLLNVLMGV